MRSLTLSSGRQPFEVLLLVACVLTGAVGVVVPGAGSPTIDRFVPQPFTTLFYVALFGSAAVSAVGVSLRLPTSLLVERIGMVVLSALLLIYGIAVYALHGPAVGIGGVIIIAFGVAAMLRCAQITRDLRKLKAALAEPRLEERE